MSKLVMAALGTLTLWVVCIPIVALVRTGSIAWHVAGTVVEFGFIVVPLLFLALLVVGVREQRHRTG